MGEWSSIRSSSIFDGGSLTCELHRPLLRPTRGVRQWPGQTTSSHKWSWGSTHRFRHVRLQCLGLELLLINVCMSRPRGLVPRRTADAVRVGRGAHVPTRGSAGWETHRNQTEQRQPRHRHRRHRGLALLVKLVLLRCQRWRCSGTNEEVDSSLPTRPKV